MSETMLLPLAPLDPRVWLGRPRGRLPFPLEEEGCRLYSRARHGLVAGLHGLGIREGDEILVPAYHHGSEVEALEHAGVRCVFYDCGADLAPDPAELETLAGPRTRALHLTHHLGVPQDAAAWRRWCDARGLALIEDAAQAWLARAGDRPAGAFGDVAIFSLYKTFGLPDGGAVLCRAAGPPGERRERGVLRLGLEHAAWLAGRSPAVARLATRLRPPGRANPTSDFAFGVARPPAATTLRALPRVAEPAVVERRRANYDWLLARVAALVPSPFDRLDPGTNPFVLPVAAADKPALLRALRARGIRALDLWSVPHTSLDAARYPRAAELRRTLVGLPVHQELRPRDLARIASAVEP